MCWDKWFSKRAIGAVNLLKGRARRFSDVAFKMEAMTRFVQEHDIDMVINTGDYTALGLEKELALSRDMVESLMHQPCGYITVPGNHDIYVSKVKSHDCFSAYFGEVMHSDMPEYCSDGRWPLVRLIGQKCAVIALNSACPNPLPWRSSGKITQSQLAAFDFALQDRRLDGRFVFVLTHYAPRLENGKNDTVLHGLINADALLAKCQKIRAGAILCGHVHHTYRIKIDGLNSEIFCAGSATMSGREGFWLYELRGDRIVAYKGYWDGNKYQLI